MKIWLYVALAAVVAACIGGTYVAGLSAGKSQKQVEWDQANREAEEAERRARSAREAAARKAEAALSAAERRATNAETKWRAERAKGRPIATAECPAPAQPVAKGPSEEVSPPTDTPSGSGIRFTAAGLGLWDSAWTGYEGEPVFGNPGDIASGAEFSGTPLPPLEAALENHAENARRWSEDRRQLKSLIELVRRLQAQ